MLLQPLDTNADFVVLVDWLVADGQAVAADAPVCLVETSKVTVEMTAPAAGILRHRAQVGDRVAVGSVIAAVLQGGEKEPQALTPSAPMTAEQRISRKARELMAQHRLDIAELPAEGFISVAVVERHLARVTRAQQVAAGGIFPLLDGIDTDDVTLPEGSGELVEGRIAPEFLAQLRADPDAMRRLSEQERIASLRAHGASIGEGVRLGDATIIYAPQVVLRDGASIDANGTVWCAERFIMGPLAHFGPNLSLRCQQAIVGVGVHAEHGITIGGGGHRDPWAVIAIGDESYLGSELHLNTCRPLLVGRTVFITNRATLLTHNVGHSYLDGYENRFAPVILEDGCIVGFNTVVYAGARIGRGAVVGSNGYVIESIPAGKLALGVPARVVGDARQTLSPTRRAKRAAEILGDLHRLLAAKRYEIVEFSASGGTLRIRHDGREYGVALRPDRAWEPLPPAINWVVWTLGEFSSSLDNDVVVMDLVRKRVTGTGDPLWTGTVREYLRKRGLRLQPGPWRYAGGLI